MKSIFFKCVRSDGSSLWAIDKYARKYEIGKRYVFDKKTPSHIFLVAKNLIYNDYRLNYCFDDKSTYDFKDIPLDNHDLIYKLRPEQSISPRVLICYGDVKLRKVAICDVTLNWDFASKYTTHFEERFTSTDFTVIGEIFPSKKALTDNRRYHIYLARDIK